VPHGGLVVGSYGHVDDLCEAMVNMVANPAAIGHVFNITGESVTVNRYIEVLADVVGEEPDIVHVPDSMLTDLPGAVFGHLFGVRHHAMMSTEKAQRLVGFRNRFDLRSGHADAYEWFRRKGYADVEGPMVDPMWSASWDFEAEAAVAQRVRRE
jgi:nucleoside-diphosphate-sugar epimerase